MSNDGLQFNMFNMYNKACTVKTWADKTQILSSFHFTTFSQLFYTVL